MAKELGDVSWYLALTAYAIGYDLEDIFRMNIEKLKARYPDGFDARFRRPSLLPQGLYQPAYSPSRKMNRISR